MPQELRPACITHIIKDISSGRRGQVCREDIVFSNKWTRSLCFGMCAVGLRAFPQPNLQYDRVVSYVPADVSSLGCSVDCGPTAGCGQGCVSCYHGPLGGFGNRLSTGCGMGHHCTCVPRRQACPCWCSVFSLFFWVDTLWRQMHA